MSRFAVKVLGLLFTGLVFKSYAASGQSYGTGDQVLTIGAVEFQPVISTSPYGITYLSDGYLHGDEQDFIAPLRLPDGAQITSMCLYSYDPNGAGTDVYIQAVKLPAGGQPSGVVEVPNSYVQELFNIGFPAGSVPN